MRAASVVGVLVVDDQEVFRDAMIEVVEATDGFSVVGAADSGEHAVELSTAHDPQLVLMDVRMPGIGGVEASRRIVESHPDVAVLLLSANESVVVQVDGARVLPIVDKAHLSPDVLRDGWERAKPPLT